MTRQQRVSKSQYHNRLKRAGFRWRWGRWWQLFRFAPITIQFEEEEDS